MNFDGDSLVVRGKDRFELGREAARVSGRRTKVIVKALAQWAKAHPTVLDEIGRPGLAGLEPAARMELEGAAGALCLADDDLLAARRVFESMAQTACTNFGAVGPATEDGGEMLSWNMDLPPYFWVLLGRFPLFVRDLDGYIPYVCFGVPALMGIGVMNVEGLTCVVNAVGMTDEGEGMSAYELNNTAMETCSTVDEAAKVYQQGPRGVIKGMTFALLMNFNTIWTDRAGNLSLFEYSHNYFHEEKAGGKSTIASTNHHQFIDRSLDGSFDPSTQKLITGSFARLGRMYALLDEYRGRIGPEVARKIVSDHTPDYSLLEEFGIKPEWWEGKIDDSTICAHAWNLKKHLLRGEFAEASMEVGFSTTMYSMQYQPHKMTSWFALGHPCKNPVVPIYWGNLLGSDAERYPGALEPHEVFRSRRETVRGSGFRRDATGCAGALGRAWVAITRAAEKPNFKE
ncbi:MAG: carcinine hydrolase/isopenicillin-N N-acyltransferase family protein [Candidatus Geothermincolia bacterium]